MEYRKYQGQTLLELIIAMGLGLFLLTIVITLFQSTNKVSSYVNGLIQIQESVRTVYYFIKRDLQEPEAKIVNPTKIAKDISKQFTKGTSGLLLESKQHKFLYFLSGSSLHRKDLSESLHNPDAIAEGIKDFQVDYGVMLNKNLQFKHADDISNWRQVKMIKITLTLQTTSAMQKTVIFIIGTH